MLDFERFVHDKRRSGSMLSKHLQDCLDEFLPFVLAPLRSETMEYMQVLVPEIVRRFFDEALDSCKPVHNQSETNSTPPSSGSPHSVANGSDDIDVLDASEHEVEAHPSSQERSIISASPGPIRRSSTPPLASGQGENVLGSTPEYLPEVAEMASIHVKNHPLDTTETSHPKEVQNTSSSTDMHHCFTCNKSFSRACNLRSHERTHTDERPFVCNYCRKTFARSHDRKRHEQLHTGMKRFICNGVLKDGTGWGCSKGFAWADALGRHFKSEQGMQCILPLFKEELSEQGGSLQALQELGLLGMAMPSSGANRQPRFTQAPQSMHTTQTQHPPADEDGMNDSSISTLPADLLLRYPEFRTLPEFHNVRWI